MLYNTAWWACIVYGTTKQAWYIIWPGVHGMVYGMASRASHDAWHVLWYGLEGMSWFIIWTGEHGMVYSITCGHAGYMV